MINLDQELAATLSPQERYDIISFAMNAADDNGFINSFVYERALYMYAAIVLYPDQKDDLSSRVADNILDAWEYMIGENIIQTMLQEHKVAIELLTKEAQTWYEEYAEWAHSVRGILDVVQDYTGEIVDSAAKRLQQTSDETGVAQLLNIADDWGMNRQMPQVENNVVPLDDSLFNKE